MDEERLSLHLVILQIAELREKSPEIIGELAVVKLAYQYLLKAGEDFRRILRKRIYVVEMNLADIRMCRPSPLPEVCRNQLP